MLRQWVTRVRAGVCCGCHRCRVKKFKDLISQATRLQSEISETARARKTRLRKLEKDSAKARALKQDDEGRRVEAQIKEMRQVVKDSSDITPSTGSIFVRLFLGRVNVRVLQEADRTRLRDE